MVMAIGFGALQSESPARNPVQLFNPALPLESVTMGNFLQDASSFCGFSMVERGCGAAVRGASCCAQPSRPVHAVIEPL